MKKLLLSILLFFLLFLNSCTDFWEGNEEEYKIKYQVIATQKFEVVYYDYKEEKTIHTGILDAGVWVKEFTATAEEYQFKAKKLSLNSYGTISGKIYINDEEKASASDGGENIVYIELTAEVN